MNVTKGAIVKHPTTGIEAMFVSAWVNPFTDQTVWNVRLCDSNLMASWNAAKVVSA